MPILSTQIDMSYKSILHLVSITNNHKHNIKSTQGCLYIFYIIMMSEIINKREQN